MGVDCNPGECYDVATCSPNSPDQQREQCFVFRLRCCEPSEHTVDQCSIQPAIAFVSAATCLVFVLCLSAGCVPLFLPGPVTASQLNTRLISAAYNLSLLSFLPQLPLSSKRCLRRSVCDQLRSLLARERERERERENHACMSRAAAVR